MMIRGTDAVSNVYILKRFDGVMIIDPSYNLETILEITKGYKILGILLTHAHSGHMNLIGYFDCPVYLHRKDYELFLNDEQNGYQHSKGEKPFDAKNIFIRFIDDQTIIPFMDGSIKVIHTPGHTRGSVCYLYNDNLYTGDTLHKNRIGKTNRPNSSLGQLQRSIKKLFEMLPAKTKIFPGHNEPSTIKEERLYNKEIKKIIDR